MRLSSAARAVLFALALLAGPSVARADEGTVTLIIFKAGWFVGGSAGSGVMTFHGQTYGLSAGGIDGGFVFGGSQTTLQGRVRNIRRAQDIAFRRLTFCLLGVATPSDLIRDSRMSPFNIGKRIVLSDFTPEEAARLAEGLAHASDAVDSPCYPRDASPLFARKSYWCIVDTVQAAGFVVRPYQVTVPSFGVWGYVLARRVPFEPPRHVPNVALRYLAEREGRFDLRGATAAHRARIEKTRPLIGL